MVIPPLNFMVLLTSAVSELLALNLRHLNSPSIFNLLLRICPQSLLCPFDLRS